jgi:hypothetical protein
MAAKKTYDPEVFVGAGSKVVRTKVPDGVGVIATCTHDGESNFIVESFASDGTSIDTNVNEIGSYRGTVLLAAAETPAVLKVVADGDWTIKLEEIANAPHWDPSEKLSGHGDGVFIVNPRVSGFLKCVAKVRGDGYFAVWAYHGDEVTLLFSEIDGYTGENVFPVETHLVTVKSDNTSWSIELEEI